MNFDHSVSLPGGTLVRKLVFTLHGWAGTPACWSLPPWLAFLSSYMVSSLWNPAKSGQLTQPAHYSRHCACSVHVEHHFKHIYRLFLSFSEAWFILSTVKRFVKPTPPSCVLCVRKHVTHGHLVTVVSMQRSVQFWHLSQPFNRLVSRPLLASYNISRFWILMNP